MLFQNFKFKNIQYYRNLNLIYNNLKYGKSNINMINSLVSDKCGILINKSIATYRIIMHQNNKPNILIIDKNKNKKLQSINKYNFSNKFDKNHYMNFEKNNIIQESDKKIIKKSKIKNLDVDLLNLSNGKYSSEQKKYFVFYLGLNSPMIIISALTGLFSFNLPHLEIISRLILNVQLYQNFFMSGILVCSLYRSTLNKIMNQQNILDLMDEEEALENPEIKDIRKLFNKNFFLCFIPPIINFVMTHKLLNANILTNDLIYTGSSILIFAHLSLYLFIKFFKFDKDFPFYQNWRILLIFTSVLIALFFYGIYKRFNGIYDSKSRDDQPLKVKNDPNRLENFKSIDYFLEEDNKKFNSDKTDIFDSILIELEDLKDEQKKMHLGKLLYEILEEN